jgi:hypothetical protein
MNLLTKCKEDDNQHVMSMMQIQQVAGPIQNLTLCHEHDANPANTVAGHVPIVQ